MLIPIRIIDNLQPLQNRRCYHYIYLSILTSAINIHDSLDLDHNQTRFDKGPNKELNSAFLINKTHSNVILITGLLSPKYHYQNICILICLGAMILSA